MQALAYNAKHQHGANRLVSLTATKVTRMASFPNTKLIPLTQGKHAIVDAEDYEWLNQWKWCCRIIRRSNSASTKIDGRNKYMHRIIMGEPKDMAVDHINGDPLDNRRCNLRICTNKENTRNRKITKGSSRYKGVAWFKRDSCWKAQIMIDYVNKHIGYYPTEEQAALAYNEAAIKYFKEFARLNII